MAGAAIAGVRKPHRDRCRCWASRDIGEYETCPHGCVYCYAVRNRTLAKHRHQGHSPDSEFLFTPPAGDRPGA